MTKSNEYKKINNLIVKYVELEKIPKRARSAMFYEYIKSEFKHERGKHPSEYELKQMRDIRLRYKRGEGKEQETKEMFEYFKRKFAKEIGRQRELDKNSGQRRVTYR